MKSVSSDRNFFFTRLASHSTRLGGLAYQHWAAMNDTRSFMGGIYFRKYSILINSHIPLNGTCI